MASSFFFPSFQDRKQTLIQYFHSFLSAAVFIPRWPFLSSDPSLLSGFHMLISAAHLSCGLASCVSYPSPALCCLLLLKYTFPINSFLSYAYIKLPLLDFILWFISYHTLLVAQLLSEVNISNTMIDLQTYLLLT